MNGEQIRIWKEMVMAISRYYSGMWLGRMNKARKLQPEQPVTGSDSEYLLNKCLEYYYCNNLLNKLL
jgi:hypothetical protein